MQLLAKAPHPSGILRPGESLSGHTTMVIAAFEALFGSSAQQPSHLGRRWLRFLRLPDSAFASFWQHGLAACALHDLGKANEDFQQLVRHKLKEPQRIRHEHLSGLFLFHPSCQQWLETQTELSLPLLFAAVTGHHLKLKAQNFAQPRSALSELLEVYPDGIQQLFQLLAHRLEQPAPQLDFPALWDLGDSGVGASLFELKEAVEDQIYAYADSLSDDDQRLLSAVRSALIVADSAGSALSRELAGEDQLRQAIRDWLHRVFATHNLLSGDDIEDKVIQPRIRQIEASGKRFAWGDFQLASAELPARALLLAACGSGKTLAAWKWIAAQLAQEPRARVIFLYPTRATSTEGFRDYVAWAPEADAALIHGTSGYELDALFDNPQDPRSSKDFTTEDRLFAIGYWPRRIFSATVDQFLGFIQFIYRSVCLMPLLADSVIVIDEVHSFDHALFSALKHFLRAFDLPVLCMTASLPEIRQQELAACGLTIFPQDPAAFADLQQKAGLPRYQVRCLSEAREAEALVAEGLAAGKRILWVVNTVARCQGLAQKHGAICYHSRFKLDDRKQAHARVIAAFQQKSAAVLALTTQVCEMSLDLDADILISECAPVPALIQRMGRCNRHAASAETPPGQVYVYPPPALLPYEPAEMQAAEAFLAELDQRTVSQNDLEQGLMRHGSRETRIDSFAAFLQSGPWAAAAEYQLRESLDLSVQAILDRDLEHYLALRARRAPTDGLILSAPKGLAQAEPRLEKFFLKTVPAERYSQPYGLL
jgi:CRISPR-associated endonuclease/helicase Cas3